jgi:hypothetical protein
MPQNLQQNIKVTIMRRRLFAKGEVYNVTIINFLKNILQHWLQAPYL